MDRLGELQRTVSSVQKGVPLARYVLALCRAKGDYLAAGEIAQHWRDTPGVAIALRSAVNFGTTSDSNWSELEPNYRLLLTELVELLRPLTVLGRLQGAHRVPFNVRVARQTAGATVGWVGQGRPKPVSELAFDDLSIGPSKIAGIVVVSNELVRASGGAAELAIRDDLIAQIAQYSDEQFLSPGVAAVANVSPASVTNGLTPITSAGSSVANVVTDVQALTAQLLTAGGTLARPYLIMTPATAQALAAKRDSAGGPAFPTITVLGGTLLGIPVLVSNNVPHSTSGGAIVVLIDADGILLADDGAARLSVSTEAALQMDSAPSSSAAAMFSLWQNNLTGVLAERYIGWKRRRDTGFVAYVDGVAY